VTAVAATVPKPWGHELIWARTDRYVGKILHIKAGEALSLQYHRVKDETVMVLRGRLQFVHFADGEPPRSTVLEPHQPFHVTPGLRHRMIALEDTDVLEVSTPELDDVVRLEDRYGRQGTSAP
jgi:mannose-6-phosphate isomerase-like protein (cupin superfamily)